MSNIGNRLARIETKLVPPNRGRMVFYEAPASMSDDERAGWIAETFPAEPRGSMFVAWDSVLEEPPSADVTAPRLLGYGRTDLSHEDWLDRLNASSA